VSPNGRCAFDTSSTVRLRSPLPIEEAKGARVSALAQETCLKTAEKPTAVSPPRKRIGYVSQCQLGDILCPILAHFFARSVAYKQKVSLTMIMKSSSHALVAGQLTRSKMLPFKLQNTSLTKRSIRCLETPSAAAELCNIFQTIPPILSRDSSGRTRAIRMARRLYICGGLHAFSSPSLPD
jgi:hypothetical protein